MPTMTWAGCRALAVAACSAVLAIAAGGCTGPPPPVVSAAPEPSQVRCDLCGKLVARADTRPRVNLDGVDVYDCKACLAKPRRR